MFFGAFLCFNRNYLYMYKKKLLLNTVSNGSIDHSKSKVKNSGKDLSMKRKQHVNKGNSTVHIRVSYSEKNIVLDFRKMRFEQNSTNLQLSSGFPTSEIEDKPDIPEKKLFIHEVLRFIKLIWSFLAPYLPHVLSPSSGFLNR